MNRILDYVREYYLQHDATPSTTKIANAMDIARGTVYKYLVPMHEKQMLTYQDGRLIHHRFGSFRQIEKRSLRLVRLLVVIQFRKKSTCFIEHHFPLQCSEKDHFISCMQKVIR